MIIAVKLMSFAVFAIGILLVIHQYTSIIRLRKHLKTARETEYNNAKQEEHFCASLTTERIGILNSLEENDGDKL